MPLTFQWFFRSASMTPCRTHTHAHCSYQICQHLSKCKVLGHIICDVEFSQCQITDFTRSKQIITQVKIKSKVLRKLFQSSALRPPPPLFFLCLFFTYRGLIMGAHFQSVYNFAFEQMGCSCRESLSGFVKKQVGNKNQKKVLKYPSKYQTILIHIICIDIQGARKVSIACLGDDRNPDTEDFSLTQHIYHPTLISPPLSISTMTTDGTFPQQIGMSQIESYENIEDGDESHRSQEEDTCVYFKCMLPQSTLLNSTCRHLKPIELGNLNLCQDLKQVQKFIAISQSIFLGTSLTLEAKTFFFFSKALTYLHIYLLLQQNLFVPGQRANSSLWNVLLITG